MTRLWGRSRLHPARPLLVSGRCLLWLEVFCLLVCAGLVAAAGAAAQGGTAKVASGAQVLVEEDFRRFAGARVGLIVNQTARVGPDHLADLVFASRNVSLVALFAPEHGLRGDAHAGEEVVDSRDTRTGAPVYSLYGKSRTPTAAMLRGLDTLVFDIQDVGARFYTYITTMGLAMQAAARSGVRFVVLDRPNPLGGEYVSGFVMRDANRSFVGKYPIPIAHGMTVGELARMIKGEAMLPGLEKLDLQVVPMQAWTRAMHWPDTGLDWVNPSPAIVDYETALIYPGMGLFEATAVNYGRGTDEPFRLIGAPWLDGEGLAAELTSLGLAGLRFEAVRYEPRSTGAGAFDPAYAGERIPGVRLIITDAKQVLPVEAGVDILAALVRHARAAGHDNIIDKRAWLAKISGTKNLARMIEAGKSADMMVAQWREEVWTFRALRSSYLLYE